MKLALASLVLAASIAAVPAYAQTTSSTATTTAPPCLTLSSDLSRGATDAHSNGAVSKLQAFLSALGYFDSANVGGPFGPMTRAAVIKFQLASGISGTGYVGPLTRAAMANRNCGIVPPKSTVSLYTVSPSSAAIGTTISLTGFGFTNSNTVLIDGQVAARSVPITSSIAVACTTDPSCKGGIRQTIQFTLPDSLGPNCPVGSMCPLWARLLTPGTYAIKVQNDNGVSNAMQLTVTGTSTPSSSGVSISGLDAPSVVTLGQSGTWTVHAVANNGGQLHYSVVWGDEAYTSPSFAAQESPVVSTSATFTHTYTHAGTFTPVFTVTDDAGHSASTSASVRVMPLY